MSLKKLFAVLLGTVLLFGCENPAGKADRPDPSEWVLHLGSFPEPVSTTYQVVVQTYSVDTSGTRTDYDSVEIGRVTSTSLLKRTVSLNPKAQYLGVYLVSAGSAVYFQNWDLSRVDGHTISNRYWVNYFQYFSNNTLEFGLNKNYVEDLSLAGEVNLDFSDRPFYFFRVPHALGKTFRVQFKDLLGASVDVRRGSSWNEFPWNVSEVPTGSAFTIPEAEPDGVLSVYPKSYASPAQASYRCYDASAEVAVEKANLFPVDRVLPVDGGKALLLSPPHYFGLDSKKLRKWVIGQPSATVLATFDDEIGSICASEGVAYVGVGPALYQTNVGTGVTTLLATFPVKVLNLALLGPTFLAVQCDSQTNILRLSDSVVTATKSWIWDKWSDYIWVPETKRLYYTFTDSSLRYLEIDPDLGFLGNDSPLETWTKSTGHRLWRVGTDQAVLTSSGSFFRLDADNPSGLAYSSALGSEVVGAVLSTSKITTLARVLTWGSRVQVSSPTAPHAEIQQLGNWTDEIPVDLLRVDGGLVAVTQGRWDSLVKLHYLPDAATQPPSPSLTGARPRAQVAPYRDTGSP